MGKPFQEILKPSSILSLLSTSSSPPTTSSASVTDTVRGSHQFKITGYSLSKGIGIRKYITSDIFTVGGYEWAIYFYPDGKSAEDNATYVSMFIAIASEGTDVKALFELTLLDQSGKERHKVHSHFDRTLESGPYTLKYRGSMRGYKQFFKRTTLEAPKTYSIAVPPSALLHFIYWDELPDMQELTGSNSKWASTLMAQHLLAAADRYGLDRLRLMCEACLCENLAINTVATTLALSEQHHCIQLKAACLKFIAMPENLRAVMQTDGFENLKESCPLVLTELLEYVARFNEHSISICKDEHEAIFDGSDMNGRRVKQRL